jgi:hypothetical protein
MNPCREKKWLLTMTDIACNSSEINRRRRLPNRRGSIRFPIRCDNTTYLVTLSRFETGELAEIFLDAEKPNSAVAIHAGDSAILASMLLQRGITAAAIRHSVSGPIALALANVDEEGAP